LYYYYNEKPLVCQGVLKENFKKLLYQFVAVIPSFNGISYFGNSTNAVSAINTNNIPYILRRKESSIRFYPDIMTIAVFARMQQRLVFLGIFSCFLKTLCHK
jgi:hypothetical protein